MDFKITIGTSGAFFAFCLYSLSFQKRNVSHLRTVGVSQVRLIELSFFFSPRKLTFLVGHYQTMIILQPVLDFLLWHHLGPNYEERAHDLLQVIASNNENRHVCSSKCIILPGLQAVFLQLCEWDEPRPPGRTIYLEDRDPADQVLKRALSPFMYFLFVIG